jgi:hypothetical protein
MEEEGRCIARGIDLSHPRSPAIRLRILNPTDSRQLESKR